MKIMFICTGNICRSAVAHRLLEKKIKDENITNIEVFSCGTNAENGDVPTYNAIEVLKDYDVDMKVHRAINILNSDIQDMDLILCATNSHKRTVLLMYPQLKGKVYTLKEYVDYDKSKIDTDISDPWGYDIEVFRHCTIEIDRCLNLLLEKIEKENN